MSSIGPTLPPHLLTKRKREAEEGDDTSDPASPSRDVTHTRSQSPDAGEKRRRVAGPAMPPAPLDEMPASKSNEDSDSDSSSDDDDFGPALPTAAEAARAASKYGDNEGDDDSGPAPSDSSATEKKLQRDDWMMVPPKQDDLAARMDPTKLRARGFQTGKGARGPNHGGGISEMWTETPEQKRKRLENEVMGVAAPSAPGARGGSDRVASKEDETTRRRIKEHNEKYRGGSLYEQHQARVPKEAEDDPSKRAFDREKDIGGGMKIGHTKRKEMLNRAADFGSKFSGGGYL